MIGVIGGTSFFHSEILRESSERRIVTPYGSVGVLQNETATAISRHGSSGNTPPHAINHHAHIHTLRSCGVEGVVCFGSVGGLRENSAPGVMVLADDFYAPYRPVSFHTNSMSIVIPEMRTPWREKVAGWLHRGECLFQDGGVYAETLGPRFETKAEVKAMSKIADVVGMTCASEATLCMEIGLPIAIVAIVDNYAHGLGLESLTGELFTSTVRDNHESVRRALDAIIRGYQASK
jgi:5'-methylthioinosine phosphorylase